ncbi:putative NAD(P)-binding protein [Zavarzinia compransoris]|nr:putative NAD(P)-binding protein [Zavarzinia compransoris]
MMAGAAAAGLGGGAFALSLPAPAAPVPGRLDGLDAATGHRLRSGDFPPPARTVRTRIAIVGGGVSGLAAARRLARAGLDDLLVLELEDEAGGNARGGRNAVSAYPWGAHYVPLPTDESTEVRRLFEELGVITGYDAAGLPLYDELMLSADPQERLQIHGRWQEGLVPNIGATADDRAQYARFFAFVHGLSERRGRDGRRPFAIPVDESSADPAWRDLDRLTMKAWMEAEGYTSERLHWYVNYSCRDDFGTPHGETSAWAGLHYFAARSGRAGNAAAGSVLTWPEGNAWLTTRMAAPLGGRIRPRCLAWNIAAAEAGGLRLQIFDAARDESFTVEAEAAILAVPRFIAARLWPAHGAEGFSYAPWAVANITLGRLPGGTGEPLAWDNAIYRSAMLGYVVATHQDPRRHHDRTVITYYWPLSHLRPAAARAEAFGRDLAAWQALFEAEILRNHPSLKGKLERIDIRLFGHAMVRPVPGFIWGPARAAALVQTPPVFAAHADLGGMSIFEEAYTKGIAAAEAALAFLGNGRPG